MNQFVQLRKNFLDFFKKRGHTIIPSSSLIPDDPSVLLTTAGMQQFKRYYTGELNPVSDFKSARTTSVQKCFRTSDIEEVGDDTHLTLFEMLGNFSFGPIENDDPNNTEGKGGYFKRSAIVWAYEFITNILEIESDRLYVTVFEGDEENKIPKDEESYAIWYKEIGIPKDRIFYGKKEDNFWGPTGNEGPCGPTSEIYIASSEEEAKKGNGVEIWNLVFNQFYKTREGEYKKVENPGIDTGMGYERLLTKIEGVANVFETSAFAPIISKIKELVSQLSEREARILTDHIRSSSFLIADGVRPSNKGAGYVLRRLLRRIIAISIKNDIHTDLFVEVYPVVEDIFGDIYKEIKNKKEIIEVWSEEKSKFESAIIQGIKKIEELNISNVELTGAIAFDIYQSYGLPKEIALEFAKKKSKSIDLEYEEKERAHQDISRAGAEKKFGGHGLVLDTGELKAGSEEELNKVIRMHTATHLLQWGLRQILGDSVHQMGSDINPERLRFDFNFERKLDSKEIERIEELVNEQIKKDLPVYYEEMSKDEAANLGALAFFKEKYPDIVKVYFIGSKESGGIISKELCGGPHVNSIGEIKGVKIIKEESVGKGIRRVRAVVID
ncbi:MAG TPA: alanine--tRNA ligase [Candidatus Paceibacterota bacterium]|nr:alanine--tRNA ligase [Candidatus Paceibacterota bacterium]